jgi:hypothetical protein
VLVRYENLRADTLGTMKRMYSALKIGVKERELARVVAKHSWGLSPKMRREKGSSDAKLCPEGEKRT